jgi:hypothetical protein
MAPGRALEVPFLWLWAETMAEDLIVAGQGRASPAAFEFRAARDVLALTFFLADVDRSYTEVSVECLELIRAPLSAAPQWLAWCRSSLDRLEAVTGASDMRLARNAWRWLGRGRLLVGPTLACLACVDEAASIVGEACSVGVHLARQIVDERLAEGS